MKKYLIGGFAAIALYFFLGWVTAGATNFDRLVLGSANYGTDPNPTADLSLQNNEYISNYVDGQISFGAANLLTTGTFGAGATTISSLGATTITGSVTATDSTTSAILKDSAGKKWKLRVMTNGTVHADSVGLN